MTQREAREDPDLRDSIRTKLLAMRTEWERRLGKIQADRRRQSAPLEQDFEEQAVQRENDQALDALDAQGRRELEAIEAGLQRLESARFGDCVRCGEAIGNERLLAQPTASSCLACAQEASTG